MKSINPFYKQVFHLAVTVSVLGFGSGDSLAENRPGNSLIGTQTSGASLTAYNEQGDRIAIQIQQVEADPHDPDGELNLYTVAVNRESHGRWVNMCAPDNNGEAKAIPLAGYWDRSGDYVASDNVTFACTSGVLAKCVRWGYKPWKDHNGISGRDLHQSCTRMARADYCGNGVTHTRNGTPINVYDGIGIQQRDSLNTMEIEAGWNPEGAVMLNRTRWPDTFEKIRNDCPEKFENIYTAGEYTHQFGAVDYTSALIYNDSIPR